MHWLTHHRSSSLSWPLYYHCHWRPGPAFSSSSPSAGQGAENAAAGKAAAPPLAPEGPPAPQTNSCSRCWERWWPNQDSPVCPHDQSKRNKVSLCPCKRSLSSFFNMHGIIIMALCTWWINWRTVEGISNTNTWMRQETWTSKQATSNSARIPQTCLFHIHQVKAPGPDTCINTNGVFSLKEVTQNGGSSFLGRVPVDTNCREVGARLEEKRAEKEKAGFCTHHTPLPSIRCEKWYQVWLTPCWSHLPGKGHPCLNLQKPRQEAWGEHNSR